MRYPRANIGDDRSNILLAIGRSTFVNIGAYGSFELADALRTGSTCSSAVNAILKNPSFISLSVKSVRSALRRLLISGCSACASPTIAAVGDIKNRAARAKARTREAAFLIRRDALDERAVMLASEIRTQLTDQGCRRALGRCSPCGYLHDPGKVRSTPSCAGQVESARSPKLVPG